MSSLLVAIISFACMFAGVMLAMRFGHQLPEHHHEAKSKDTVRLGMGLIATLAGLVLSLILSAAKTTFDTESALVKQSAVAVLQLDRALLQYGPETAVIRSSIHQVLANSVARIWPEDGAQSSEQESNFSEAIVNQIVALQPVTPQQHWYRTRALALSGDVLQARWEIAHGLANTIPPLLLVSIIAWLTVLFASFGLFAPRNRTVIVTLLVCSLSIATAILLILEMEDPFAGIIKVSSEPLRFALTVINH